MVHMVHVHFILDSRRFSKKKMESQLSESEKQLEVANRLKDDYSRQFKKYQQMIKELQHEAEDARQAKEDFAVSFREMERKLAD